MIVLRSAVSSVGEFRPPSENESGVVLRIDMTCVGRVASRARIENVPSPILVVVDMGVEAEDASLRKLSRRGTRVWPIEGVVSGMMLKMGEKRPSIVQKQKNLLAERA